MDISQLRKSSGASFGPCKAVPTRRHAPPAKRATRSVVARVSNAFIDLAQFMVNDYSSEIVGYEELSEIIGEEAYVNVNGWHLYLRDIKAVLGEESRMSTVLAQRLGLMLKKGYDEDKVDGVLKEIPLKIGNGAVKISLFDAIPDFAKDTLKEKLEDYARNV